jgi:FKBP-type peptidyl-prolyl cis-trans isomerase
MMRVGDRARLTIPPNLAYGAAGMPPDVPPDATLIVDLTLVGIQE